MDETDYAERIRALESRLQAREDAIQCAICMERDKQILFLCGHGACRECSERLETCHICRRQIQNKIQMYQWQITTRWKHNPSECRRHLRWCESAYMYTTGSGVRRAYFLPARGNDPYPSFIDLGPLFQFWCPKTEENSGPDPSLILVRAHCLNASPARLWYFFSVEKKNIQARKLPDPYTINCKMLFIRLVTKYYLC